MKKLINLFKPWHKIPEQYSIVDYSKVKTVKDLTLIIEETTEYRVRKTSKIHEKLSKFLKD